MDVVRFVDSVTASPTVRLNLNDGTIWKILANGTEFPPPPLRYATAQTMLADGARIPAAAFDNRIVRLHLQLGAAAGDSQATQIQNLARELNRPRNILMWQSTGMTNPVFFRTYRSSPSGVLEYMPTLREATIDIPAEPFAYGLKQTLSAVTVYNDPTEGVTLNANPYFETNAANWSVTGGTFVRSTAQFHEGAASGLLTPDGVTATAEVGSELVAVTAGKTVRVSSWVRTGVTRSINIGMNWYNSTPTFLSADVVATASITLNTWTFVHFTAVAPANTAFVQMKFQETGTPPASNTLFVDESRINVPGTSGGACWEITGIKGDVETPAIIRMPADTVWSTSGDRQSLFATRRRGTPSNAPFLVQAEACTQGVDMATVANDTAMSGAGNNFSRYTPATAPTVLAKRLTVAAPPDSTDLRGIYRVLLRYRKSVSGDVFGAQMRWGTSAGGTQVLDEVTLPSGTLIRYADLGYVSYPVGVDPVGDGFSGVEQVLAGMTCEIWARRVSGSGNLDFDFMLWVPADDSTCYVSWVSANDNTHEAVLDGAGADPAPASRVYLLNAADSVYTMAPRVPIGGVPLLSPGQTNRIVFIRDVGSSASTVDAITGTTALTVSYYPRYVYIAGATT